MESKRKHNIIAPQVKLQQPKKNIGGNVQIFLQ